MKCYLAHFRGDTVPGGRQGDAAWNTFAGIPCQVGSGKSYLERFRRNTVPGGRQGKTPGTLLRENRARWTAKQTEKPPFLLNLQGITHSYEHY